MRRPRKLCVKAVRSALFAERRQNTKPPMRLIAPGTLCSMYCNREMSAW